jgi:hypothetical protein
VGSEPHEPIQAKVIRSEDARGAIDVPWLATEFKIDPERRHRRGRGRGVGVLEGSLEDNLVAGLCDGTEGTVGVEDAERVI